MYRIMSGLLIGLAMGVAPALLAAEDEGSQLSDNKGPDRMKEKVVEARAEKNRDTGGLSKSGSKYIYVNQKDIDAASKDSHGAGSKRGGKGNDNDVNIGSTTIGKNEKVHSVDVVVKADKGINVKTNGKADEVNIGQVKFEKGAAKGGKVDVNVIVDAKKIEVKTDGKPTDVNIGQVKLEKDMTKSLKADVIIDAKEGIKVH